MVDFGIGSQEQPKLDEFVGIRITTTFFFWCERLRMDLNMAELIWNGLELILIASLL